MKQLVTAEPDHSCKVCGEPATLCDLADPDADAFYCGYVHAGTMTTVEVLESEAAEAALTALGERGYRPHSSFPTKDDLRGGYDLWLRTPEGGRVVLTVSVWNPEEGE